MQVIGFNFTKISASRNKEIKHPSISTNIEFLELEKEKIDLLKEQDSLRLDFMFSILYQNGELREKAKDKDKDKVPSMAEVKFEGNIILLSSEEESKELLKGWKKKDIDNNLRLSLFNLILKKCSARALALQEELNIPSHIPIPQVSPQAQPNQ